MFGSIIDALKTIIDLRTKAREDKKAKLEIQKLVHELSAARSRIQQASFEDIRKYDAKIQELERKAGIERESESGIRLYCHNGLALVLVLLLVIFLILGLIHFIWDPAWLR